MVFDNLQLRERMNVHLCSLSASWSSIFVMQFQCLETWLQDCMPGCTVQILLDAELRSDANSRCDAWDVGIPKSDLVQRGKRQPIYCNRLQLSWCLCLEVQQRNRTSCVFLHKLPVCVTVLQWANQLLPDMYPLCDSEYVAGSKNCVRCLTFQERYSKAAFRS